MKGIKNKNNQQKLIAANLAVIELQVQLVKTKLSCETSLQNWKWKLWKKNRARPPSQIESWRSEKKTFVRDIPQKVKVEDVKTKLSYETSLQKWKLKMWKQSFHARLSSKSGSWISLLCDFFAVWRLCSGTSVLCGVFAAWRLCSVTSLLWDFFAVGLLCCVASLLCDVFEVWLLCCGISLLCDFFAVRRFSCETSLPWRFFAVGLLCSETSLLWDFFAV